MKKITDKFLQKHGACDEGYQWWIDKGKTKDSIATLEALMADNHFDWANWLIVRLMTRDQKIKYAIYAAEQVIDIYEKKYPDDNRLRKAILAAKKYLKNKTKKNKKDAADAAYAADCAADAAAYAAACAADAAARESMQIKIIKYGIKLVTP